MALLSLYVIFFGIWGLENYRRHGFNMSVYLITLYFIGSVCCMCIMGFYPSYIEHPDRISFGSVASHILFLWLFMYPLVRYGNTIDLDQVEIAKPRMDAFAWCVAVPAVLSVIASSMDVGQIFLYGNLLDARKAFMAGDISNLYVQKYGAFGYLLMLGTQVSMLATFLFFYYYFYLKRRDMLTLLLFVSTLGIVTNNLAIAGREGLVRWILCMLGAGVMMRGHISWRENRRMFAIGGTVGIVIFALFLAISIDRFNDSDNGVFFSFLRYGGEQFFLYSYGYERFFDSGYDTVGGLFPIISQEQVDMYFVNRQVRADFFLNTFPTFVGTFVKRVGFFNTLALSIGAFLFFFLSFWKRAPWSKITLTKLTAYLFYYEFVLLGFFYYLHGGRITQFCIILYILLAFCLSRFTLKSNEIR